MVKGGEVYVFTLVQKFKFLTQVRQRELDGSSEKDETDNGISTFRYLKKDHFDVKQITAS